MGTDLYKQYKELESKRDSLKLDHKNLSIDIANQSSDSPSSGWSLTYKELSLMSTKELNLELNSVNRTRSFLIFLCVALLSSSIISFFFFGYDYHMRVNLDTYDYWMPVYTNGLHYGLAGVVCFVLFVISFIEALKIDPEKFLKDVEGFKVKLDRLKRLKSEWDLSVVEFSDFEKEYNSKLSSERQTKERAEIIERDNLPADFCYINFYESTHISKTEYPEETWLNGVFENVLRSDDLLYVNRDDGILYDTINKIIDLPYSLKMMDKKFIHQIMLSFDDIDNFADSGRVFKVMIRSASAYFDVNSLEKFREGIETLTGLRMSEIKRVSNNRLAFSLSDFDVDSVDDLPNFVDFDGNKLKKGFIYFGETIEGSYYLDIKKMTHFLVVGVSGSGKSVFLNNLITSVRFNSDMFNNICLADLKGGVEFFPYASEDIDKLDIIDGLDSLRIAVKKYLDIMRSNLESMKERGLKKWDGGCELLLIDEYSLIQLYKPTDREEKSEHAQLLSYLNILSAQGRAAGIRLIVGLQKSSTDNIDSSFKNNLQSQVCFKVKSALDVTSVFGSSDFKEELGINPLKFGKGRCLIYDDSIQEHKLVQVPFFDDNKVYRF